jgi:hypothetical protein
VPVTSDLSLPRATPTISIHQVHPEQHEVAVRRIGSNLGHPPQVWSHAVFWALRGTLAGLGPTLRPDRGASISE